MKINATLVLLALIAGIIAAVLVGTNPSTTSNAVTTKRENAPPIDKHHMGPTTRMVVIAATGPSVAPAQSAKKQTSNSAKARKPVRQKPPIQDPMARVALSFVGADPEADDYWIQAINDPTLPAEERKDLIEDLNEDGLSDPHHPGPQDMPLIASRIQLIEELAPWAMDQVDSDAFNEAYKDLVNLYNGVPAN
jgi:hypothetical protein